MGWRKPISRPVFHLCQSIRIHQAFATRLVPTFSLCGPDDDLPAHAASLIVAAADSPDLADRLIVVPSLNLAPALRNALGRAGAARGYPTLIPPRITTLDALIADADLAHAVVPTARRLADLQRLLAVRGWFGGAPRWDACRAILGLADELSARLPEPRSEAGFMGMIEAHYRGRGARVAEPEARLVYEVWRAYARPSKGAPLDPGLARRMLLASAARALAGPLVCLSARPAAVLEVEEQAFITLAEARYPVTVVAPAALPATLHAAWPAALTMPLAARAATLGLEAQLLFDKVRVWQAPTLEAEARAALRQVRVWLAAGKRSIALIAVDRLVARRVRALLERDHVLLADEAGWKLSTTSAATCAMRWVDAVSGGFHQRDLLDWLRSPFVFADFAPGERARALAALERAVRDHNVQAGLGAMRHALERAATPDPLALKMLARLEATARPWARRAASLDEWFALLLDSLRALGAADALAADAAGVLLLDLAGRLRDQLGAGALQSLTDWREFFASELEAAVFRDSAIDSPLVMTSIARAQLRRFEGTLLLGAGEAHLGAEREPGPLFAARLRAQLQLATPDEHDAALRDALGMLIAQSGDFRATWQSGSADEVQPLSQYFVRLDALARSSGHAGLIHAVPADAVLATPGAPIHMPAPHAFALRPATLSVSAYASLIACPYQFFARHMLGLNEADEVREEFEKSDYGQWVHALLNRLHARFPAFAGNSRDVIATEFCRLADEVFAPAIEFNFLSLGWKQRWVALADAYISWQFEREGAGWKWQDGEVAADVSFALANGQALRLRGRLDRIDARASDGMLEILDYKTQDAAALTRRVADVGEDVQLAAYRLLHPAGGLAQAAFVAVDGGKIRTVAANSGHRPEDERRRLIALVNAIDADAGLAANGVDRVCAWCEMRGLCRRDHWALDSAGDG